MMPKMQWKTCALEELASVERGRFSARPRNDPRYYGGATPFIQTGDVAAAKAYLRTWNQTLNAEGLAVSKIFPSGTIFITIAANIGNTAISTFDAACPDSVVGIRPEPNVDRDWLYHSLTAKKNELESYSTQNAQKNINLEVLKPLALEVPPLREQLRIAEILRTWDEAIDKTERLIAAKEKRLLWLSTALLFGDIRSGGRKTAGRQVLRWFQLPSDWRSPHLDEIAEQSNAINKAGEDIPVLSCTKYDGLVESLKYFGRKVYSEDTSPYKIVERGQFAYATNHLEEGSIGYQDFCDRGLVSPMYTVFKTNPSHVNDRYLLRVFKTGTYLHIFQANTSASVDRRGGLRWEDFSKIRVPLPGLDEQDQIDRVLSAAQTEIGLIKAKKTTLEKQKRGLMQKLLTGEWPVPLRDSDVDALAQRIPQEAAE